MLIYYLSWPKMSPVVVYISYAPHAATSCSLGCLTVQNQEGLCLKSCFIQLPLARFILLPLHGHVICNSWPKMRPCTSGMTQKATVEVGGLAETRCLHQEKRSCVSMNGSVLVIPRCWVPLRTFEALSGVCTVCVKGQCKSDQFWQVIKSALLS